MQVELSAGTVDYEDTGGPGTVIVLVHGPLMDSTVWRKVVPRLSGDHRCVTPTLPLGAHRRAMRPDADLSLEGMVRLLDEFLERLDLHDVVLVANDWGGPALLPALGLGERVGRLVLVSCEAFDNFPPGLPGRILTAAARIPSGLAVLMQGLRFRLLHRAPGAWGWMAKHPVPREVMDAWFAPSMNDAAIRRDLAKYATSVPPRETLLTWFHRLEDFSGPALVVWGTEDKVMPRDHGRRLAEILPHSTLVELPDTYTLVPEDAPEALSDSLLEFLEHPR